MNYNRPTFMGIGAQKGGTSWLYQQLMSHPDIWLPPVKELHFFDLDLERISQQNKIGLNLIKSRVLGNNKWEKARTISTVKSIAKSISAGNFAGISWWLHWTFGKLDATWYRQLFLPGKSYKCCGDITPAYSTLDESKISLIKEINPDMKLIFILRNPIDRAWSAAKYSLQRGKRQHNLDSVTEVMNTANKTQFELRSNYERTLNRYLKYFDSSQILVCFYDAIKSDPIGLISGITDFLEIPPLPVEKINNTNKVNASFNKKISPELKECLMEKYAPMTTRLAQRLGSYSLYWDGVDDSVKQDRNSDYLLPCIHP